MSEDVRLVNDAAPTFHFDLLIEVLGRTLFSPAACLAALLAVFLNDYERLWRPAARLPLAVFTLYVSVVLVLSAFSFIERCWRNRSWRHGFTGVLGRRKINWDEQIVLVTGGAYLLFSDDIYSSQSLGASGLGRQLVDTLAVRHLTTVVLDVQELSHDSESVYFYRCDVSDRTAVLATAQRIREEVGDPTVLINNAGVVSARTILDLSEENIKKTFGVNVLSHFWTVQAFLPAMLTRKTGHIISVASILSWAGVVELTDYCATKSALLGFHESLRAELRHVPDIRLSMVYPGHIATPLFAGARIPNALARFLLPTVDTLGLSKAIIRAIDAHESRDIYIPWMGRFAWLDRASPYWFADLVHWLTGVDEAFTPNARAGKSRRV